MDTPSRLEILIEEQEVKVPGDIYILRGGGQFDEILVKERYRIVFYGPRVDDYVDLLLR